MPTDPIASITIANKNVLNLLAKDMQKLGRDIMTSRNMRQAFERIRDEVMRPTIDKNFEVGGRPPWVELQESSWIKRRTSRGGKAGFTASGLAGGLHLLIDTGQMRRHAIAKARFQIKSNVMTYGKWPQRRWFGPLHDLGLGGMPERAFVVMQPEDQRAAAEIMGDWVMDRADDRIRRRYV